MYVFLEGALKIVEKPEAFSDENGQTVEYFINHIKSKEGTLLVVNSKDSYEEHEGKEGIFKLRVRSVDDAKRSTGGNYRGLSKLSLAGFAEGENLPEDIVN